MSDFTTKQLKRALSLQRKIDALEQKKSVLLQKLQKTLAGQKAPVQTSATISTPDKKTAVKTKRGPASVRKGSQKQLIREVLTEAGKPLSIDEIYTKLKAKGLKTKAKDPKKTLGVILYTDNAVYRPSLAAFALKPEGAAQSQPSSKKTPKPAKKRNIKAK
jgi:hypothetical protein